MTTRKAYTLVEILLVIGLVMIMSTIIIAVINPNKQQDRAKDAVVKRAVADIASSIELFKASSGRYPSGSDVSYLQPFVSNGYTLYTTGELIGFHNPTIDNGTDTNSIYWDSAAACLQSELTENDGEYAFWKPGEVVSAGMTGCSQQIADATAGSDPTDSGPPSGGSSAPVAPSSNEYNQNPSNTQTLIAYYKIDETSGAAMIDSSKKANHGSLKNGALRGVGVSGSSLLLNGVNQYGRVENMLGSPRSVTVSAWVNITGLGLPYGSEVISIGDNVGLRIDPDELYGFYNDGTADWPKTRANAVLLNKGWNHVAYVMSDGVNNDQIVYLNGSNVAETHHDNSITYAGLGKGTSLGDHANPEIYHYWFKGRIDEVRVYNYAQSQSQIQGDMNAGLLATVTPPYGYLKLDDTGDTATAALGTLTGNLGGSATCPSGATNCPSWSTGYFGGAVSFNGSQNDVIAGTGTMNFTPNMSFSMWVNTTGGGTILGSLGATGSAALRISGGKVLAMTNQASGSWALYRVDGTTPVNDGQWHHIAWVLQGTTFTVYVDGKADGTSIVPSTSTFSDSSWYLGYSDLSWSPIYYTGSVDEFRVFNYALTPAQVNAEYRR